VSDRDNRIMMKYRNNFSEQSTINTHTINTDTISNRYFSSFNLLFIFWLKGKGANIFRIVVIGRHYNYYRILILLKKNPTFVPKVSFTRLFVNLNIVTLVYPRDRVDKKIVCLGEG